MTPSWLTYLLAGLMLVVAAYCAGRVVYARLRHRETEHDIDLLHVLMGVAMAGMLASRLSILSSHVWEAMFAATVVWFAVRIVLTLRGSRMDRPALGHRLPYLLAPAAMLYMYLAPITAASGSGGGGMAGMADSAGASTRFPAIGLVLAVCMAGFAVLTMDRITLTAPASPGQSGTSNPSGGLHCGGLLAPRAANSCHIAMSITMAYMLIVLL